MSSSVLGRSEKFFNDQGRVVVWKRVQLQAAILGLPVV